jgi:tellurite resistance protein TerC
LALWIGFLVSVLALVAIDLLVVRARGGVVSAKAAGVWVGIYVALSLGFAAFLYLEGGPKIAATFLTAYVIEYALSVDNLFVFLVIFSFFKVKKDAQHRLLYWGVVGAFAMRAGLISLGASLVTRFSWILYGFGAFLLFTAWKLLFAKTEEESPDLENNKVLQLARRVLPVATREHGLAFVVKENGRTVVTALALVLLVVEASDLIFALDSIPAALGISQDPFIIFTANACAIMGLRSLFFVVAKLMDSFHYLKAGLGIILAFVGLKMIAETFFEELAHQHEGIVILVSLGFIALVLTVSVLASVLRPQKKEDAPGVLMPVKEPAVKE